MTGEDEHLMPQRREVAQHLRGGAARISLRVSDWAIGLIFTSHDRVVNPRPRWQGKM